MSSIIDTFIKYGDQLDICLTIVDMEKEDRPLIYINNIFTKETGYTGDDVIGKNCRFLQGERTNPDHVENIRTSLKEKLPIFQDIVNYTKDGEPFLNRLILFPIESGDEFHFIGIQNLLATGEAVFSKENIIVERDIIKVAHDVKNILNRILGSFGIMEKFPDDADISKYEVFAKNGIAELKEYVLKI